MNDLDYTKELDYTKINKENFEKYENDFKNLLFMINGFIFYKGIDNPEIEIEFDINMYKYVFDLYMLKYQNKNYLELQKKVFSEINTKFELILKASIENKIYTRYSVLETYIETFENRFNDFKLKYLGFNLEDFVKSEIDTIVCKFDYFLEFEFWNDINKKILKNSFDKIFDFLQKQVFYLNIKIEKNQNDFLNFNKFNINYEINNENNDLKKEIEKTNKGLLFEGKPLNLEERFIIAKRLLDIEKKIITLNISKNKQNELLSYILGCHTDNAKNLLNCRKLNKTRDNEINNYLNDLGIK